MKIFSFFWSSSKSGQKNELNLSENLFCDLHLFGLYFSHPVFTLSTFSNFWLRVRPPFSKILRTPLEQGSATYIPWAVFGPRSQTSIRDPLCDYRKSLATQPNPALKLPQHLMKPFLFLRALNYKSAKNYLKTW